MPRTEILALGGKRLAQQFRIGQHEIRRRDRIADLLDVERGLLPRLLVDFGLAHQALAPLHGEQIDLLEEVEELVLRPFRIGESLVLGIGRDHRGGRLAGHALGHAAPQFEVVAAETGLQFERALVVRQPIFQHLPDGLDHFDDVVGRLAFDFAFLARLHIGGERLAAFFDHAGDIMREGLNLDRADLRRLRDRFHDRFFGRFLDRFFGRSGAGLIHRLHVGPRRENWPGPRPPARCVCVYGFTGCGFVMRRLPGWRPCSGHNNRLGGL